MPKHADKNTKRHAKLAEGVRKVVATCMAKIHDPHKRAKGSLRIRSAKKGKTGVDVTFAPKNNPSMEALAGCVRNAKHWPADLLKAVHDARISLSLAIRSKQ